MLLTLDLFLLFIAALAIGIVGNIAGIGGGVLLMIIFLFILKLNPVIAGGLSLITIIASALSGSLFNRSQGAVDRGLFLDISVMAGAGALIGSVMSYFILLSAFKLYFGITVLGLGLFSFLSTKHEFRGAPDKKYLKMSFAESGKGGKIEFMSYKILAFISLIAGIISGLFGVGIGAIVGTFLTSIKHVHPKVAFSSVLASMIITSIIGTIAHLSKPGITPSDLLIMIPLVMGAVAGGASGAYISNHMSFAGLRNSQSYIIIFFGILSIAVSLITRL